MLKLKATPETSGEKRRSKAEYSITTRFNIMDFFGRSRRIQVQKSYALKVILLTNSNFYYEHLKFK